MGGQIFALLFVALMLCGESGDQITTGQTMIRDLISRDLSTSDPSTDLQRRDNIGDRVMPTATGASVQHYNGNEEPDYVRAVSVNFHSAI